MREMVSTLNSPTHSISLHHVRSLAMVKCVSIKFFFFKERRSFLPSTVCPSSNISNCQRFSISRKSKIKIRYPPQTESHTFFCLNTAQIHKPSALTEPQSHLKSSITRLQLNKHFLFFFYIDVVLSARQRGGEGRQKKKTLKDFERLSFVWQSRDSLKVMIDLVL